MLNSVPYFLGDLLQTGSQLRTARPELIMAWTPACLAPRHNSMANSPSERRFLCGFTIATFDYRRQHFNCHFLQVPNCKFMLVPDQKSCDLESNAVATCKFGASFAQLDYPKTSQNPKFAVHGQSLCPLSPSQV